MSKRIDDMNREELVDALNKLPNLEVCMYDQEGLLHKVGMAYEDTADGYDASHFEDDGEEGEPVRDGDRIIRLVY